MKQSILPSEEALTLMENFRLMANDCIRVGLGDDASSLKRLSKLTYGDLKRYGVPSCYRLCAISKAAGMLAAMKKSIRRGFPTKRPYVSKPVMVSCYGFKVRDGCLVIPLGGGQFEWLPLNRHTLEVISAPSVQVRSFTMTETSLSLCIRSGIQGFGPKGIVGVDRNLRNITVGNEQKVVHYDVSRTVDIASRTRSIIASFKRNDARIRKKLAARYGRRRRERVRQILHRVSKAIVEDAKQERNAIAFEDIRHIRRMYGKGSGQGTGYRGRMNSWPFHELKRQVEYKTAWEGVPVVTLSVKDTRGTTMDCPRCGERLQAAARTDAQHHRQLWCGKCERWDDRDLVAVMNISKRGWLRFDQSKGGAGEAVTGNPTPTAILRVDASKGRLRYQAGT